jgi:hypothetical protein
LLFFDLFFEHAVGRGNEPKIRMNGFGTAHPLEGMFLQYAKQLRL